MSQRNFRSKYAHAWLQNNVYFMYARQLLSFVFSTIRRSSVLKKDAFAKYERKYMVFGEKFDKEPK